MWCAWHVTRDTRLLMLLSIFTPKNNNHLFFHAMVDLDAESDGFSPTSAPTTISAQLQSVGGGQWENASRYLNQVCEGLLDVLDEYPQSESDGDRIVTWKKHDAGGRSTSVHIRVHRGRSRSPRRQVGEPQAAAIPHAESHLGIAPAECNEGKD